MLKFAGRGFWSCINLAGAAKGKYGHDGIVIDKQHNN